MVQSDDDDDTRIMTGLFWDLGERAMASAHLSYDPETREHKVLNVQLIDVTQQVSRQVDFVVERTMELVHTAYDHVDVAELYDFVQIEEQPDINKQTYPTSFALREYFRSRYAMSPKRQKTYKQLQRIVGFIHGSIKNQLCYELKAEQTITASVAHDYNKAMANAAGKLICSDEEYKTITQYKRTHDIFDCVLMGVQFFRLRFQHVYLRAQGIGLSDIGVVTAAVADGAEQPTPVKNKKTRKPRKTKAAKSIVLPVGPDGIPILPKRFAMPKAQRLQFKAVRAKKRQKLEEGQL